MEAFLSAAEVTDDITDKVFAVRVSHDVAVQVAGLDKIVIGVREGMTCGLAGYVERRFQGIRIGCGAAEAVGPVIRTAAPVAVHAHGTIPLVAFLRAGFRRIHGNEMVVRSQAVDVRIVV